MFSDFFGVSITGRIRLVFGFYALISLGGFIIYWQRDSPILDWEWIYLFGFAISAISCLIMTIRPRLGTGSLHLFPLWAIMLLWVIDVWTNFFFNISEYLTLNRTLAGSLVPVFVIVSISYIDLLESRIYHRLVETLGKETD